MLFKFGKITIVKNIYLFILMWYAFLASSSNALRPHVSIVWILLALFSFSFNKGISFKISKISYSYIILCISLVISLFFSQDFSTSLGLICKILLYLIITMNISVDRDMRNTAIKFAYIFLLFHLAVIYIQLLFPNVYNLLFFSYIPNSAIYLVKKCVDSKIAIGFNTQTGIAAFWMTLGFLFSLLFYENKKGSKFLFFSILFGCAILLTLKRIFLLISIIVILVIKTVNTNKKGRMFKILFAFTGILLLFFILTSLFPELTGIFNKFALFIEADDVSNGRIYIYKTALEIFLNNSLVGIGYGAFLKISGLGVGVHNAMLQTLTELGIFGFLFFWYPLLYCFSISLKSIKNNKIIQNYSDKIIKEIAFVTQLVVFMWCLTGNPFIDDTVFFIFLWMQMVSISIAKLENIKSSNEL